MGTRAWGRRGGYRPRPGAPQAIPGPLPTADPAPPSLSHPQHNHTTTHHPATPRSHPAPPATQSRPAPPTTYSAEKILHICFPAVPESLQPNDTPGRPNQKQIPSSAGIHRTPHPPQARSAAWLRAKLLPISHPGVQGCHPGTVGSLAPSLGVAECAAHPAVNTQGHRDPPQRGKDPPANTPTYPDSFSCPLKPCPSSSTASLSHGAGLRRLYFKVLVSYPALCPTMQCWTHAARCRLLPDYNTGPPTSPKALQSRSALLHTVGAQEKWAPASSLPRFGSAMSYLQAKWH